MAIDNKRYCQLSMRVAIFATSVFEMSENERKKNMYVCFLLCLLTSPPHISSSGQTVWSGGGLGFSAFSSILNYFERSFVYFPNTAETAQLRQHNRGNYTTPTIYQNKIKTSDLGG